MNRILLVDRDLPAIRPLCRFSSVFSLRTGIYSTIERIELKYKKTDEQVYYHPDKLYENLISKQEGYTPYGQVCKLAIDESIKNLTDFKFKAIFDSADIDPFALLQNIAASIKADLGLWKKNNKISNTRKYRKSILVPGKSKKLFIHKKASVEPGCVLDTRKGPIVLDAGVQVSAFSVLAGPLYVGKNARLDNVRITGGCSVGKMVRLGGEIENTLIQNYSNKHHEGFLGHSLVGNWVNIGALATTSDLKNNYGMVKVELPLDRLPGNNSPLQTINTNSIKFGSVIGDCVKIAIGTMLNTGTVIDAGSNIFGGVPGKYTRPLSWGLTDQSYETDRFIADCKKIFSRRNKAVSSSMIALIKQLAAARQG